MFRLLSRTACLALLLALPGAHAASAGSTPATKDPRATARAAMKADVPYMAAKVRASGKDKLKLNLADTVQYRFLKNRLAATGKTTRNSPKLFAQIEWQRKQHLLGIGIEQDKDQLVDEPLHVIAEFAEANGKLYGTTHSAVPGGSFYTYLDVALWEGPESAPTLLGEIGIAEQFGEGTGVFASTETEVPIAWLTGTGCSPKLEDSVGCVQKSGALNCTYLIPRPACKLYAANVTMPVDTKGSNGGPDGVFTACLDRSNSDCDIELTNTGGRILLPLKGSVTFLKPISKSQGKPVGATLKIALSLAGSGDYSEITSTNLDDFWNHVTFTPVGTSEKIEWNWTADFGGPVFKHENLVHLSFDLSVQHTDGSTGLVGFNTKPESPHQLPSPLRFAYSCLAAGTQIRLTNGTGQAIETVSDRESIRSRVAGPMLAGNGVKLANLPEASLTVVDRSIGVERIPMVRLATGHGHSLLLTEGHPVFTDRGPVLAKLLQKGDVVLTESGPSRLVEVGRESYDGKVYNLKLGTGDELAAFPDAQASMFANGILVGDGRMQTRMQDEANRRPATTLEQIPRAWRKDFRNSQRTTAKK